MTKPTSKKRKTQPKGGRTYQWRNGHRYKTSPEAANAEFERIREVNGALTTTALIDESRPEEAVCHDDFEWRDPVAAEKFREVQARTMIRSLEVVVEREEPRAVNVHIQLDKGEGEYVSMETAVESVDLFTIALSELQRKLGASVKAVHDLERIASNGPQRDKLAVIKLAVKAVEAASRAITELAK